MDAAIRTSGDFAVFRLTPEKYHYTHVPAAGAVADFYGVNGRYHSCNPHAAVQLLTPYSKNRRVVTVIDTDCEGGDGVGYIAMIEVVALMVGQIEQRYSEGRYDNPQALEKGMFLRRGAPKALFRPGSSTVVLLFQPGRVRFAHDLVRNQQQGRRAQPLLGRLRTAGGRNRREGALVAGARAGGAAMIDVIFVAGIGDRAVLACWHGESGRCPRSAGR